MIELRQVTVLFCDLVDSTALTGRLDPEDQKAVFDALRNVVRVQARAQGAQRLRFVGDGARAVFGYPDVLEDAPRSALRCGLALVAAIRAVHPVPGVQLELRVGIAFGTSVLGEEVEETSRTDEGVVGTVPALAVRLAAAAPPGGVAIDHAMWRLVGRHFECRDMGPQTLKGFADGMRCWRVLAEQAVDLQRVAIEGGRLLGRAVRAAELSAAWQAARWGNGGAVLLVGDPGVGKSHLAHALVASAGEGGAKRLVLECTPRTCNTPLYPLVMWLRQQAGIDAGHSAEEAEQRARRLLEVRVAPARLDDAMRYLGPLFIAPAAQAEADGESAERTRERTITLLLDLVGDFAGRHPLLILLEDLQWCDPSSAELLRRLLSVCARWQLLIVVTARPEAGADLPGSRRIELGPLGGADARELVEQLAAGEPLTADCIDRIVERGEGIPLFLEELTRSAMEAAARHDDGGPDATPESMPHRLHNIIQSRLDRRTAADGEQPAVAALRRSLIQAAAVLGREFALAQLHDLLGGPASDMHNMVARLIDDGVLNPPETGAAGRLRFKHALIHEAAYKTLLRSDRRRLHARAADLLAQQMPGTPEAAPDVIAYHLRAADRVADAARCLVAACTNAVAKAAYQEAVGHSEAGLALLGAVEDAALRRTLQLPLLVLQGVAQTALLGYAAPEVETAYRQALALCDESSDPSLLYPIIRGLATYFLVRGDLAEAYRQSQRAMQLAADSGRPEFRIDALCVHAYTSLYTDRLADSRRLLEECLALYAAEQGESLQYPVPQDAATGAWALLPTARWLLGDAAGAEAAVVAGLAHVDRLQERLGPRPFDCALLHAWTAGTRYTQRRHADAARHAQIAVQISQHYGFRDWLGTGQLLALQAQAAQAPAPEALAGIRQVMAAFAAQGVGLNGTYYLWGLAQGLARAGAVADARQVIALALQLAAAGQDTRMNAELLLLEAELEDEAQAAQTRLLEAFELAERQSAVPTALRAGLSLVLRGASADAALAAWARERLQELEAADPRAGDPQWLPRILAETRLQVERLAPKPAGSTG